MGIGGLCADAQSLAPGGAIFEMKQTTRILLYLVTVASILLALAFFTLNVHAADLKESYLGGHDAWKARSTNTRCQTWTATSDYILGSVTLKMNKSAGSSPGTITLHVQDTTAGVPNVDIATGTYDGSLLPNETGDTWASASFPISLSITNGTVYAFCPKSASSADDNAQWGANNAGGYAGGSAYDGGTPETEDFAFWNYSADATPSPSPTASSSEATLTTVVSLFSASALFLISFLGIISYITWRKFSSL